MSIHPDHCDIPGCMTLYLGTNSSGVPIRKRGKADFYVRDRFDIERGICTIHYLRGLVEAGMAPNQHLLDADGRYDVVKVRSHWDSLAQIELAETAKRKRYGKESA